MARAANAAAWRCPGEGRRERELLQQISSRVCEEFAGRVITYVSRSLRQHRADRSDEFLLLALTIFKAVDQGLRLVECCGIGLIEGAFQTLKLGLKRCRCHARPVDSEASSPAGRNQFGFFELFR